MRVLVCGGRDFYDHILVEETLGAIHATTPIAFVIHGNANGADRLGGWWARKNGVKEIACPAEWSRHGKRAGPIRNQNMLGHKPVLVVAFPGGAGTRDMAKRARIAGIEVRVVKAFVEPTEVA